MNGKRYGKKRLWAVIPPWLIIGAVVILVPVFIFMTIENINRQKEQTTRLLVEKGAALIRSFEAGARTGIGLHWGGFQLQKLLMETAEQPDIDYLIVTDTRGTILADSDPLRIGAIYGQDLDLAKIAGSDKHRLAAGPEQRRGGHLRGLSPVCTDERSPPGVSRSLLGAIAAGRPPPGSPPRDRTSPAETPEHRNQLLPASSSSSA